MRRTLLSTAQVSTMTGVPQNTLRWWRYRGYGPKSFKLGRRVVYSEDELTAWIEHQHAAEGNGSSAA